MSQPVSIPKFDGFLRPVLLALEALGGSASISEIDDHVAQQLMLGPEAVVRQPVRRFTRFRWLMLQAPRSTLKTAPQ